MRHAQRFRQPHGSSSGQQASTAQRHPGHELGAHHHCQEHHPWGQQGPQVAGLCMQEASAWPMGREGRTTVESTGWAPLMLPVPHAGNACSCWEGQELQLSACHGHSNKRTERDAHAAALFHEKHLANGVSGSRHTCNAIKPDMALCGHGGILKGSAEV